MKHSAVVLICLLLCAGHLYGQNLITNPGFENGLASWGTSPGAAVYTADATVHHSGAFSLRGVEPDFDSLGRAYQNVTAKVTPGNQYVLSGWIKTLDVINDNDPGSPNYGLGNGVVIGIGYENASICCVGSFAVEVGHVAGTQDWTFFESAPFIVPPMPAEAVMLAVYVDFNAASGTAWIDDVQLTGGAECTVQLSQTTYGNGDDVVVSKLRIANTGTIPVATELKIWFVGPGFAPISLLNVGADGSLTLPVGFEYDPDPYTLFQVMPGYPRGAYELGCRGLDPVTGKLIAEGVGHFSIE